VYLPVFVIEAVKQCRSLIVYIKDVSVETAGSRYCCSVRLPGTAWQGRAARAQVFEIPAQFWQCLFRDMSREALLRSRLKVSQERLYVRASDEVRDTASVSSRSAEHFYSQRHAKARKVWRLRTFVPGKLRQTDVRGRE
jgi:hypothetical protein